MKTIKQNNLEQVAVNFKSDPRFDILFDDSCRINKGFLHYYLKIKLESENLRVIYICLCYYSGFEYESLRIRNKTTKEFHKFLHRKPLPEFTPPEFMLSKQYPPDKLSEIIKYIDDNA